MAEPKVKFEKPTIEVEILIVGAGPAGASLGCFLGQNGVKGLIITAASSTVRTPRAHYTNPATMECLRDIGIEDECIKKGIPQSELGPWYRWGETVSSGELTRRYGFSHSPYKQGEYFDASPCKYLDLPQTESEPILIKYAMQHGFNIRFNTRMLSFVDDEKSGMVTTLLEDILTGQQIQVKSRFLAGADGARSKVAEQLGLSFTNKPGGGLAINVPVKADLSHIIGKTSNGMMHGVLSSSKDKPEWAVFGLFRVLKPWTEWLVILGTAPSVTNLTVTREVIQERIEELIGDPTVKVEMGNFSEWTVNEAWADETSKGNVFCLGDAIHRHPPANGLGSNTCIQDAYNLAWKMAYVIQKKADPSLLASYNVERQPVAKQIVAQANDTWRLWFKYWSMIGSLEPTPEARLAALEEFEADTEAGRARRKAVSAVFKELAIEGEALGTEMNQVYDSSSVYLNEEDRQAGKPVFDRDPGFHYQQSTYPGFRLPHAWLGGKKLGEMMSTQDITGKGRFTLLTGIGGIKWATAAKKASDALPGNVDIECYSIGYNFGQSQDYSDAVQMWETKREIEENGAILVRPDRYIAWRCHSLDGFEDCDGMLLDVMRRVLGFEK